MEEFRETCRENAIDGSYLKVTGFNIRRHFVHIDGFLSILQSSEYVPDVCVLVETWLTNENRDAATIEGYDNIHVTRELEVSGGVSLHWRNDMSVTILSDLSVCNIFIETCSIEVRFPSDVFIIIGIYRPHSGNVDGFIDELTTIFF